MPSDDWKSYYEENVSHSEDVALQYKWQVFFEDDSESDPVSEQFDTQEEAEAAEKKYWKDYFEKYPDSVVYYAGTRVRYVRATQ